MSHIMFINLRGTPLLPWRLRQQVTPKARYHVPHHFTSCTRIPYSEYIVLFSSCWTAGTECACGKIVVSTYQTVRDHNPEEYITNSYNRHDKTKSQPSTYSESNLWTSKAVAWTVLEMGEWLDHVSVWRSWADSGEDIGCSRRRVLLRFETPCIVALLRFDFLWNAGSIVPLISS